MTERDANFLEMIAWLEARDLFGMRLTPALARLIYDLSLAFAPIPTADEIFRNDELRRYCRDHPTAPPRDPESAAAAARAIAEWRQHRDRSFYDDGMIRAEINRWRQDNPPGVGD